MGAEMTFVELVELHERKWGIQQYSGRPKLSDLLRCPIVAVWVIGGRFTFTVHHLFTELDDLTFRLITGKEQELPDRKLAKVFVNQEPYEFTVRLLSAPKPAKSSPPAKQQKPEIIQHRPEPELVRQIPEPETIPRHRKHAVEYGDHLKVELPSQRAMKPGRQAPFRLHVVPEDTKPPKKPEPRPGETVDQFRERMEAERQDRIKRILLRSQGEL